MVQVGRRQLLVSFFYLIVFYCYIIIKYYFRRNISEQKATYWSSRCNSCYHCFHFIVYLPILLTDHYQLSLQVVGLLYLPMAISLIIGSMTFKTIQSKISQKKLFITGNVVLALSVILFAVIHSNTLIGVTVALILHGISIGILTPLFATMIANEFEHNRGSAMGMFNFIRYMGMAVGPIVSGL
ncbi:MFS transporter [Bacillus cereus]|nr:MFS transporter [Bacillus thuringiensis]MED4444090.1 MFS transporter [Bacillus cereus]